MPAPRRRRAAAATGCAGARTIAVHGRIRRRRDAPASAGRWRWPRSRYRSRQEAAKAFERLAPPDASPTPTTWARAHAPALAEPEAALRAHPRARAAALLRRRRGRPATAGVRRARFPERAPADRDDRGRRAARAASICSVPRAVVRRLRSTGISIRCRARRAPRVHWSRDRPARPGDGRRQQGGLGAQPPPVARAAGAGLGAHRRRALCAGVRRRRSTPGCDANPPGIGINWASSLEVAFRLISWCWTLLLIRDCARALEPLRARRAGAPCGSTRRTSRRYLSHYFSPNTHLTGEALGLLLRRAAVSRVPRCGATGATVGAARAASTRCRAAGAPPTASTSSSRRATSATRSTSTCTSCSLAARNGVPLPRDVAEQHRSAWWTFLAACGGPTARCPRSATPTAGGCCR